MAGGGLIGKLRVWIGVDNSDYKKGLNQSKQQTSTFAKEVGGTLKSIGGAFAIGAVIKKAFDFSKEAYLAAAQAQGVKIAFDRLNDPNLLVNLKEATKGTIDEMKLMQLAVQSKNFKLPVEQLGTYLKFATKRAQETGQSVDYLTNSIITGLGRKSVMILDNLGISAVEIRDEMKKGGDMAQAVGQIIQREMAKAGEITETAAVKAEKIDAKWADFLGNAGNTAPIQRAGNAIQDFLITALDALNDSLTTTGRSSIEKWIAQNITNPAVPAEKALENLEAQIKASDEALNKWGVNSAGLSWWQKGLNDIGRGITKVVTLGFVDTKRDEEFARNARMAAHDAYNERELKAAANAKVAELDLNKKSYSQLLGLQSEWALKSTNISKAVQLAIQEAIGKMGERAKEGTRAYVSQALEELKTELDQTIVGSDDEKRILKKISELEKTLEIKKEIAKVDGLKDNEATNTKRLAFLKSQEQAYGTTLVFQEELLAVMREREGFMRSDDERITLKAQNDELERQIKLRKEGLTGIAAIESQISKIEADLKITADPAAIKKMGDELSGKRLELKAAVIATLPDGSIERLEAELNKIEFEKSLLKQGEQSEWEKLEESAKNVRSELDKFPKEIFPEGSAAEFDQEIAKIENGMNLLTGSTLEAAQASVELLKLQKEIATNGAKPEARGKLGDSIKADRENIAKLRVELASASGAERDAIGSSIEAGERQIALWSDMSSAAESLAESIGSTVTSAIGELASALGDSEGWNIGSFVARLLDPLGDAAIQAGLLTMGIGAALEALKTAFSNLFGGGPAGAIASGAALLALGVAAKAGAAAITKGSGAGGSSQNPNTFTGGYSYGSNSPSYAATNAVSRSSEQEIVVKGEISGDKLRFVLDKDAMRRKS